RPIRVASGLPGGWSPGGGRGNPYTAWPSGCQATPPYSGRGAGSAPPPPPSAAPGAPPFLATPPEPLTAAGPSAAASPEDVGGRALSVTVSELLPARLG